MQATLAQPLDRRASFPGVQNGSGSVVCTREIAGEVDELLSEEMPIPGTRRKAWTQREHARLSAGRVPKKPSL